MNFEIKKYQRILQLHMSKYLRKLSVIMQPPEYKNKILLYLDALPGFPDVIRITGNAPLKDIITTPELFLTVEEDTMIVYFDYGFLLFLKDQLGPNLHYLELSQLYIYIKKVIISLQIDAKYLIDINTNFVEFPFIWLKSEIIHYELINKNLELIPFEP